MKSVMDPVVMVFLLIFMGSLVAFLLLAVRHRRPHGWGGGVMANAAIRETVGELAIGPYGGVRTQLKVHILARTAKQAERLGLEILGGEGDRLLVALSKENATHLLALLGQSTGRVY